MNNGNEQYNLLEKDDRVDRVAAIAEAEAPFALDESVVLTATQVEEVWQKKQYSPIHGDRSASRTTANLRLLSRRTSLLHIECPILNQATQCLPSSIAVPDFRRLQQYILQWFPHCN
jgi:hypothetical protein